MRNWISVTLDCQTRKLKKHCLTIRTLSSNTKIK
nr:MAG TPA: hypothetical protein [Caudoviricetes sp.]